MDMDECVDHKRNQKLKKIYLKRVKNQRMGKWLKWLLQDMRYDVLLFMFTTFPVIHLETSLLNAHAFSNTNHHRNVQNNGHGQMCWSQKKQKVRKKKKKNQRTFINHHNKYNMCSPMLRTLPHHSVPFYIPLGDISIEYFSPKKHCPPFVQQNGNEWWGNERMYEGW